MKYISRITASLILLLCIISAGAQARSTKESINRNLSIFTAIYKTLQSTYVDSIDLDKSMTTAINAMLNDIDPYTEYYAEKDREELTSISSGDFGGIGAYIRQNAQGNTVVTLPQPGTPAAKAGLKAGDIFVTINSDTVLTLGSDKVRELLRGQAGTSLNVTVRRPYTTDSIKEFKLTRAKIEINPLPYAGIVNDSIAYIKLTTYNNKSASAVADSLRRLKENHNVKGVILDLRSNGGGLMESAVEIVGHFVPKGTEVLRTRGRNGEDEKIYKTTNKPIDTEIPLAVLIDGGSASSSEITAGALQDLDRAVIIGQRSYGKGLVQSSRMLPYNGILKVTVSKYYIPSGRLIQAIDYSHRNPDGSVARTPDSLTNVFYTRLGREVRDGGGITPDVEIPYPEVSRLAYNIVLGQWDFNFSTRYASEHDSIPSPEKFEITDEIYEQFKQSIDPEKFEYDKLCELIIDELEEAIKIEGYTSDEVTASINALREVLKHDLNSDLDIQRQRISNYLGAELIDRYYPGQSTAYTVRHDPEVARAAEILASPDSIQSILSAPAN